MADFITFFFGGVLSSSVVLSLAVFISKESFKRILDKEFERFKLELNATATAWNLASAFSGEISAILKIIEKRKIIDLIEGAVAHTEGGNKQFPEFSVKDNYFNVYRSSISNLGLLPAPLPGEIATFYTYLMSVAEDLNYMAGADTRHVTKEKALADMKSLIETLTEAVSMGNAIIDQIKCGANNLLHGSAKSRAL